MLPTYILSSLIGGGISIVLGVYILYRLIENPDVFTARFFLRSTWKLVGFGFLVVFFILLFFGQTVTVLIGISNRNAMIQSIVAGTTFENIYIDSFRYTALFLFIVFFFLF